jgi:hypothetical protein
MNREEATDLTQIITNAMLTMVKPDGDPIRMIELRGLLYVVQTLDALESRLQTLDRSVTALSHKVSYLETLR